MSVPLNLVEKEINGATLTPSEVSLLRENAVQWRTHLLSIKRNIDEELIKAKEYSLKHGSLKGFQQMKSELAARKNKVEDRLARLKTEIREANMANNSNQLEVLNQILVEIRSISDTIATMSDRR